MNRIFGIVLLAVALALVGCDDRGVQNVKGDRMDTSPEDITGKVVKTDKQWRQELTSQQYDVLRKKGTERAFTGEYDHHFEEGRYLCAGCGTELFTSEAKYNSGCGWPAFTKPADNKAVDETADLSYGMDRVEITCSKCGGHLGHVFNDGPPEKGGLRYCINSASLEFKDSDDK